MQMVHPADKSDHIAEREKLRNKLRKIEDSRNGYYVKVEHFIKPYYKFVRHE